ncbi:MAG: hypothetical protein AUH85_05405 [Chloroflexi bacterium 13_1_40CM_4_68_4]|nr:MAG: hypothetical protein AUH85_05405 [Chloroflexi bacterium 13_1_40CM_4_68_4]
MSVVEAGIPVVAAQADACPLCASHQTKPAVAPAAKSDVAFPWFLAMTAAVVIASVGIGPDRFFGIGAVTGIGAGALLAVRAVRRAMRIRDGVHADAVRALNENADDRVAMVIKQFEWAVNDVVKLKREHERAQVTADLLVVQGRARERHIRKIERDLAEARERVTTLTSQRSASDRAELDQAGEATDDNVRAWWGLHTAGGVSRLELECDMSQRPTRIRITDRFGELKIKSMTAMHSGDGSLTFAIGEPPADLVAALETGRDAGYRFEALCQYEWRPVRLIDTGRRTKIVQDRQGRLFRVNDADAIARMTTFNPFDLTSDSAQLTLN